LFFWYYEVDELILAFEMARSNILLYWYYEVDELILAFEMARCCRSAQHSYISNSQSNNVVMSANWTQIDYSTNLTVVTSSHFVCLDVQLSLLVCNWNQTAYSTNITAAAINRFAAMGFRIVMLPL
jgi:hypothetical protein